MKNRNTPLSHLFIQVRYVYDLILIFTFIAFQVNSGLAQRIYRNLTNSSIHEHPNKTSIERIDLRRSIEQQTASFLRSGQLKERTISVIFHIVYFSEKDRIALGQVMSQIDALNRDFNSVNHEAHHQADTLEGFLAKAANPGITFCLAEMGVVEGERPGIHYHRAERPFWGNDDAIKFTKTGGTDAIAPQHYLNIWVTQLDETTSGYAQMPGGPDETDGIVIDHRFFGTNGTVQPPYNEGKTLTHLVGNYLNLYDIWGTGVCSNDNVEDTPIHNAPNYGCPGYRHISTCSGNQVEMTMNFMDNTDDACMYMFTHGQVMRMHATLAQYGPRAGLVIGGCNTPLTGRWEELPAIDLRSGTGYAKLAITLYPNPATSKLHLLIATGKDSPSSISVFNSYGAMVYSTAYNLLKGEQQTTLDCVGWPSGSYFLRVKTAEETASKLFFVRD